MNRLTIKIFLLVIVFFACFNYAHAAAKPAYSGRMNNVAGSLFQFKAQKLGFAANDPRFVQSLARVSTSSTSLIAEGAAATTMWPRLLLVAGIATLGQIAMDLTTESPSPLIKWNADGTINLSGATAVIDGNTYPICQTGQSIIDAVGTSFDGYCVNSARTAFSRIATKSVTCSLSSPNPICTGKSLISYVDSSFAGAAPTPLASNYYFRVVNAYQQSSDSDKTLWNVVYGYTVPSGVVLTPPAPLSTNLSPEATLATLTDAQMTKYLSDAQLANFANTLIHNAVQSAPLPLPQLASSPFTQSDVNNWRAQNPALNPTVADLFSPVAAPGTKSVVIPNPLIDDSATPTPGTQTINVTANVDWGTFENPVVPESPETSEILDPLFSFFPSFNNFHLQQHQAECPRPIFHMFNRDIKFNQMCDFIQPFESQIHLICLAMFSIISFIIVIRA
ncbi:MAG: hypothetical protein EOO53_15975 [Gammaproteobacteria bacterium]|nr:MAG: hypothetical protein EOO53_15975 [Gammaproteobacteria bacterium]